MHGSLPVIGVRPDGQRTQIRAQAVLKSQLDPTYHGQIVAIEVESGDYFIGKSVTEAARKAREKYPEKVFYFVKIGFPAVHVRR